MSSDISHRIPLTMHLQPLRMRHITCPMPRGKFFPHIWNPWPRFAYLLYNFYGATMTFKGRLLLAPLMLKLFFGRKFQSSLLSKSGPKMSVLGGKEGVDVKVWFCDPQKAHPCKEPRHLTYFASKFVGASWLYVISWTPKNSQVNNGAWSSTCPEVKPPLFNLDKILQGCRYPRRNHIRKFWWR